MLIEKCFIYIREALNRKTNIPETNYFLVIIGKSFSRMYCETELRSDFSNPTGARLGSIVLYYFFVYCNYYKGSCSWKWDGAHLLLSKWAAEDFREPVCQCSSTLSCYMYSYYKFY